MSIVLWILQVLMAAVFAAHGVFMVAPPAEMVEMINAQIGSAFRLFLGVAEIVVAIGLILPAATRILPQLVAAAGAGLMVVMSSATVLHAYRGETSSAITTLILFVLVTVMTYGRWKVRPIAPRKLFVRMGNARYGSA